MSTPAAAAPRACIDHLAVAADTLAAGVAWCERTLGLPPGPVGEHRFMGTHNRLLRLHSAAHPRAYLEIIAINPDAPAPQRPRWFDLDNPALRQRLFGGALPTLIEWQGLHPAAMLPDSGLRLDAVQLGHPNAAGLRAACTAIGLQGVELIDTPEPRLQALLQTPRGPVLLKG